MSDVEELAAKVEEVVANPDAAIAIRSPQNVYLYVNDTWERISGSNRENVIGKKLSDLTVVPADQSARFMAEDQEAVEQRRLVTIQTYHVQTSPIRFMSIRAYVHYKGVGYIVEVSFILGPLILSEILNWSSDRLERAFGDDLARNLLDIPKGDQP